MKKWASPHAVFLLRLTQPGVQHLRELRAFEMIFFAGLAVHFLPYIWNQDRFLGHLPTHQVLDVGAWLPATVPNPVLLTLGYLGCLVGILGPSVRVGALLALVAFQSLMSRNSNAIHTLAISQAWNILLLFMVGGGSQWLGRKHPTADVTRGSWTRTLIVYSTILGVFLSALEKLKSGWIEARPMTTLLSFPENHVLRNWAVHSLGHYARGLGFVLTFATLMFELFAPLALTLTASGRALPVLWVCFFAAIGLTFEVPTLFLATYAGASLLFCAGSQHGRGEDELAR